MKAKDSVGLRRVPKNLAPTSPLAPCGRALEGNHRFRFRWTTSDDCFPSHGRHRQSSLEPGEALSRHLGEPGAVGFGCHVGQMIHANIGAQSLNDRGWASCRFGVDGHSLASRLPVCPHGYRFHARDCDRDL